MKKVYRSKLDTWLAAVLFLAVIIAIGAGVAQYVASGFEIWWSLLPSVIVAGFIIWIMVSTQYTIDGHLLIVQSGPFKWRVPIVEITEISPTSNPLSSPALSLDRLRIEYRNGKSIMVSPEDKNEFISDLRAAGGTFS
jgi:hypothetical protein